MSNFKKFTAPATWTNSNSICSLISDCKFGLFVDDLVLWVSDSNSDKLVSRLNKALGAIYDWALFHQMTFDFRKFHLLDVGGKLDNRTRRQIVFGSGSPPWSKEAPYLGILLDDKLSFKPFLNKLLKRLEDDTNWRLDKHQNFRYGAYSAGHIFDWVFPSFRLWIMRVDFSVISVIKSSL